jgi:hypothetical protein
MQCLENNFMYVYRLLHQTKSSYIRNVLCAVMTMYGSHSREREIWGNLIPHFKNKPCSHEIK